MNQSRTWQPIVADNYLNSEFLCKLSGSQISIILYQLEAIPQKRIDEDPELASDLNQIFSELEYCADHHKEFN
jgi:hypothetical protein|tara:strand:- start:248 stop:466 length:219 start_codon:yes stop_codon:yes gene_type:complete